MSRFLRGELDPALRRRWWRAALVRVGSMGALSVYTEINLVHCLFPMTVDGEPYCVKGSDGTVARAGSADRP